MGTVWLCVSHPPSDWPGHVVMAISEEQERASPMSKHFSSLAVMFGNIPLAKQSQSWAQTRRPLQSDIAQGIDKGGVRKGGHSCSQSTTETQDYPIPKAGLLIVFLCHFCKYESVETQIWTGPGPCPENSQFHREDQPIQYTKLAVCYMGELICPVTET